MKGPRCMKHTYRHYQVNDCDGCKEELIAQLQKDLAEAVRIVYAYANDNPEYMDMWTVPQDFLRRMGR